jgi:hypothetical protein
MSDEEDDKEFWRRVLHVQKRGGGVVFQIAGPWKAEKSDNFK